MITIERTIEIQGPPEAVFKELIGGGRLNMRQTVVPTDSAGRAEVTVDHDLPGGSPGDVLLRLYAERRNKREVEHSLQNLEDLVEGQQSGGDGNTTGASS